MRDEQMSGDPQLRAAAVRRGVLRLTAKAMPDAWLAQATSMGMLTATEARRYMFDRPIDNKDVLAKLDVPLLVVIGGKDGSTPETQGRELAARVRGAEVAFYPEAGHSPFVEEPQRFNRELAQFARSVFGSR
jgi:pimeloyl-ACP methyl ester carboxylesterase